MPTVALKTLGCKLNQCESEQMRAQFVRLGYTPIAFSSPADLYVINSCTVTSQADSDARKLVRQARRLNPHAFIVLTGCYAEVAAEELRAMPELDLVCGMADKARLGELVPQPPPSPLPDVPAVFGEHTRGLLKIQEGCNSRCTYCIVPEARGPSRSVPFAEVYEQAVTLAQAGHPELVLIGTHLGQYGTDLQPSQTVGRGLVPRRSSCADDTQTVGYEPPPYSTESEPDMAPPLDVVELTIRLAGIPEVQRLRISSLEPREVSDTLIDLLRRGGRALETPPTPGGKLCRHLHIPLQSGCDTVLQRMNRPYTAAFYADLVRRVHEAQPLTGIGSDVIVGFPGETDEEFEVTRALLDRLPISYLHVFTYSPRRGTPAADMPNQVPPPVKAAHNQVLRELSARKHLAFAEAMVGQALETVLQTVTNEGWLEGVTDNYLTLRVQADERYLHRLVACEVRGVEGRVLVGRLVE